MRFLGKWLAPWYSGLAFSKFANKKYEDAARLFEKASRLDSNSDRMELIYSCLGRCYLALGRLNEALKTLSMAYELFDKGNQVPVENSFEQREYREFLKAYSYVLKEVGQVDHALEIARKADEVVVKPET